MGDSGEGLVDSEARIQERIDELNAERANARRKPVQNPEERRKIESLKLARTQLEQQLKAVTNPARRAQLAGALDTIDQQIAEIQSRIDSR